MRSCAVRVLVVDDDAASARSLIKLLKLNGYDAHCCLAGDDAMAAIERLRPDLVFLDLSMPFMNGYQIAEELRENPDLRPALLVALTGYGQKSDREHTAACGFDEHLLKPASWEDLEKTLSRVRLVEQREKKGLRLYDPAVDDFPNTSDNEVRS